MTAGTGLLVTRESALLRAAMKLREHAAELRRAHTLIDSDEWLVLDESDARARVDHDEMLLLADALLVMARTL